MACRWPDVAKKVCNCKAFSQVIHRRRVLNFSKKLATVKFINLVMPSIPRSFLLENSPGEHLSYRPHFIMVFSSPIFLFLFLPVVLAVYTLLPGIRAKNSWLLLMSLVFYAWGEVIFIFLLLASTLMNYFLGLWVDRSEDPGRRKLAVAVAVCANLGLLCFFKYADFFVATLNSVLRLAGASPFPQPNIPLPIGISFFTFHALSYMVDIYRRKWKAAVSPKDVALYIFFFPQLIAGPILRWNAIAPQLVERTMSRDKFAEGIRRFVGGLTKKMLIANSLRSEEHTSEL